MTRKQGAGSVYRNGLTPFLGVYRNGLTPFLGGVIAALAAVSAAPAAQEEPTARFSSGVQAVEVYATVTDAAGEPVTGLKAGDFQIDDDRKPQAITTFA